MRNVLAILALCCMAHAAYAQPPSPGIPTWERANSGGVGVYRPVTSHPVEIGRGAAAGVLRFREPNGENWTAFQAQAQAAHITYTLPSADAAGVLTSNGSGALSWATVESGITIDTTPITGGGTHRLLFESATGKVSESPNLTWDGTQLLILGKMQLGGTYAGTVLAGNWLEFQNSSSVAKGYIQATNNSIRITQYGGGIAGLFVYNGASGRDFVGINKELPTATLHTVTGSATTVGQIIELAAAQTANAFEVNSSGGSGGDLLKVAPNETRVNSTLLVARTATAAANELLFKVTPDVTYNGAGFVGILSRVYFEASGSNAWMSSVESSGYRQWAIHVGSGLTFNDTTVIGWANKTYGLTSLADKDTGISRNAAGVVEINNGTAGLYRDVKLRHLIGTEVAADPADPAEGGYVLWQSDGTGAGDDGDLFVKITAGGVTKTITLVDFSAF